MNKYKDAWTMLREVVEETIKFKDEPYTNQQWLDSLNMIEKDVGIKEED
jgi:hypothetical protein